MTARLNSPFSADVPCREGERGTGSQHGDDAFDVLGRGLDAAQATLQGAVRAASWLFTADGQIVRVS
jgi:hypothetical protein